MSLGPPPLCTVILYAYQERPFIEEAIQSILAQDYSPLEVVLSDDGSTDGTFEAMKSIVDGYSGPHRLLLNQNPKNVGIGSQLNACVSMTKGELIFLANGDDVSESFRISRTVEAWLANGRPSAVWSALRQIDESGQPLGHIMDMKVNAPSLAIGMNNRFSGGGSAASVALVREVFIRFGPLPENLILEDSPLFLRAMLLGGVHYVAEPLVRYRVHRNNISQSYAVGPFAEWQVRNRKSVTWQARESVKAYLQMLRDLHQLPAENWPSSDLKLARLVGLEKLIQNALLYDYYTGDRTIPLTTRGRMLIRLGWQLLKIGIKQTFPFIERRNEKWQYKSVTKRRRF